MGKILGKSALCFVALAVDSWLIQKICECMLQLFPKPLFFSLIWMFILEFLLWLLLPITYSYLLFLFFNKDRHCFLIMVLNGVFVIVQYYILLLLPIGGDVITASLQASKVAGVPVILLALLFNISRKPKRIQKMLPDKSSIKNVFGIMAISIFCFLMLLVGIYGFSLLCSIPLKTLGYLGFFIQDPLCAFPIIFIAYSFLLFRSLRRHRHRLWIMSANAFFLMALCAVRLFIPDIADYWIPSFSLLYFTGHAIAVFGNTALLLPILALVFRSVEKHSQALLETQNAPTAGISAQ